MHKTKRKIFEEAMKLIANKGYESASIEEITAVVGIAKGTFYYHFNSKDDMFEFLIEEGMNLLKNSIKIKTDKEKSYIDKIKAIILIQIKVTSKYDSLVRVILSQMWGTERRNLVCKKCVEEYIQIIEGIVNQGIIEKEINGSNSETIAYGIFGLISFSLLQKQKANGNIDIIESYNEFSNYIVKSLKN